MMKSVTKLYKVATRQLLDKIKDNPDVLHWNEKGEVTYENKAISGCHVVDLVNDILRQRKGFEPVGWSVFGRTGTNERTRKLATKSPEAERHPRI